MADRNTRKASGPDFSSYVVDPATALSRLWESADLTASPDYYTVKTGVRWLDQLTFAPGQSCIIVARPGHGKSMFLQAVAKRLLDQMAERGTDGIALYVTLEEPSQKLALRIAGLGHLYRPLIRGEMNAEQFKTATADLPLRIPNLRMVEFPGIVDGRMAPPVSPAVLVSTVERMVADYGRRISAMFIDYAQLLRGDGVGRGAKLTDHITEVSHGLVHLKRSLECPMFIAAQSGRMASDRGDKIPTLQDLQHASALEQDADMVIGQRRPIVDERDDSVEVGGRAFVVTPNLVLMRVLKARQDSIAGMVGAASLNPVTLEMGDIGDDGGVDVIPPYRERGPTRW